ncbi:MAG TPA: hypothetical protein VH518_15995 [Tepidisphaeraceae bacterium]|jgi:hypothetical protein
MAVRLTEKTLPANTTAADLGQAEGDPSAVLISYHSSPVVKERTQTYVVFVLDAGLQGSVASYRWQAGSVTADTENGVFEYAHPDEGDARVTVNLLDGGGTVLKSIAMTQTVIPLNAELETMIDAPDQTSPTAADPETSRELVNDVRGYIDELVSRTADAEGSLNKLLFAVAYAEAMLVPPVERASQLERLAGQLAEGDAAAFSDGAVSGIGLCQVRPDALAMYVSATPGGTDWMLPRQEMPNDPNARGAVRDALKAALIALDEAKRVDLFNLLRFPKINLKMAMQFLEAMQTQYYPGQDLPSILADQDKAKTLISEYKEGPFALA